jgi:hypothetical protein
MDSLGVGNPQMSESAETSCPVIQYNAQFDFLMRQSSNPALCGWLPDRDLHVRPSRDWHFGK